MNSWAAQSFDAPECFSVAPFSPVPFFELQGHGPRWEDP